MNHGAALDRRSRHGHPVADRWKLVPPGRAVAQASRDVCERFPVLEVHPIDVLVLEADAARQQTLCRVRPEVAVEEDVPAKLGQRHRMIVSHPRWR